MEIVVGFLISLLAFLLFFIRDILKDDLVECKDQVDAQLNVNNYQKRLTDLVLDHTVKSPRLDHCC